MWTRKRLLLLLALLSVPVVMTLLTLQYNRDLQTRMDQAALSAAAILVCEYMRTHDGNWPENWTDLKETHRSLRSRGQRLPVPMDELKQSVRVDFNADPEQLRQVQPDEEGNVPFRVITSTREGQSAAWANVLVYRYLATHPQTQQTTQTQPQTDSAPADE